MKKRSRLLAQASGLLFYVYQDRVEIAAGLQLIKLTEYLIIKKIGKFASVRFEVKQIRQISLYK